MLLTDGWAEGWRDGWAACEVWVDRWALLMKQKKRGILCFVIYIAGERKIFFLFMKCL